MPTPHPLDADLDAFIQSLPKTETHLHLEGALPFALLQEVARDKFPQPPESWQPDFKFRDFAHFEQELLAMAFSWYSSPERYHRAAREVFAQQLAQNVRYVETSFASGVIEFLGLPGREIAQAIAEAAPEGLQVKVFLGIHHNGCSTTMRPVLEDALSWPELAGVDLHGTETFPLEPWTSEIWAAANEAGKRTKAHAGEFMGADFVHRCVEELGVRYIQHGVRAVENPRVVALLRKLNVTLDTCPTSNVKLMPGVSWSNHPLPQLIDAGVCVTVSTDDPISFGNTLNDEYRALFHRMGLNREQLAEIAANGFRSRGLPVPVRK